MKDLTFMLTLLSLAAFFCSCDDNQVQNSGSNNNNNNIPAGDIFFIKKKPGQLGFSTYSINKDGTNLKLINDTLMVSSSSFSGKISLVKLDNSGYFFDKLYIADTNGNNIMNIPRNNYYPVYFIISPIGDKILFTDMNGFLCTVNIDGSGLMQISNGIGGTERVPKFSPDGKRIAFFETLPGTGEGLYTINPDGTNKLLLKDSISYGQAAMLDWSPNGDKIVFENNYPNTEICVIDTNGSNYIILTDGVSPSWSKDGSRIAFLKNVNQGLVDVFVINTDGSGELNISNTLSNYETEPYWSPSNLMKILFITSSDFYGDLKIYDVNTQNTNILVDSVNAGFWKY